MSRISPEFSDAVRDTSSEREIRTLVQVKYDYKHIGLKILVVPMMPLADPQLEHVV